MTSKRALVLKKEVLTELGSDELRAVAGAAPELSGLGCLLSQFMDRCVTDLCYKTTTSR